MNTNSPNNEPMVDEFTWQALVDGDLSRAELRKLIALCDKHPQLWKECAVAFLEEQALKAELGASARAEGMFAPSLPKKQIAVQPSSAISVIAEEHSNTAVTTSAPSIASESQGSSGFMSFKVLDWCALAACIVIAFTIGAQSNRSGGILSPENGLAQTEKAPSTVSRLKPDMSPGTPDPSTALVRNNANKAGGSDSTQFISLENEPPKQFEQLREMGLESVKTSEGFVPVRLPDGSAAIVPVQEYRVRPKGFAF